MIYIVEDDENIRRMESYALSGSEFSVREFAEGESFFAACKEQSPQLVILDIMLPGEDGYAILRRIRAGEAGGNPAVIMVTAKGSEIDKVMGLDGGADDYIAKPFGVMEFLSRVKAVLRRAGGNGEARSRILRCGRLFLDEGQRLATADGTPAELTFKEFELLKFLMEHCGQVLSRQQMMDSVWDTEFCGESRTVDMHIRTLRQKLGRCSDYIRTVRGIGYQLKEPGLPADGVQAATADEVQAAAGEMQKPQANGQAQKMSEERREQYGE